jgi:hypothetical protein
MVTTQPGSTIRSSVLLSENGKIKRAFNQSNRLFVYFAKYIHKEKKKRS